MKLIEIIIYLNNNIISFLLPFHLSSVQEYNDLTTFLFASKLVLLDHLHKLSSTIQTRPPECRTMHNLFHRLQGKFQHFYYPDLLNQTSSPTLPLKPHRNSSVHTHTTHQSQATHATVHVRVSKARTSPMGGQSGRLGRRLHVPHNGFGSILYLGVELIGNKPPINVAGARAANSPDFWPQLKKGTRPYCLDRVTGRGRRWAICVFGWSGT